AFLKNCLGPTIKRERLGDKKIIVWDHNRDLIYQRASTILTDPKAAQYVWGIGYHWYEPWSGGEPVFDHVKLVHENFPDKNPLLSAAFINTDGKVSVVVMNKSDQKISYYLWIEGQAAEVNSLPHSIQTLVFSSS